MIQKGLDMMQIKAGPDFNACIFWLSGLKKEDKSAVHRTHQAYAKTLLAVR